MFRLISCLAYITIILADDQTSDTLIALPSQEQVQKNHTLDNELNEIVLKLFSLLLRENKLTTIKKKANETECTDSFKKCCYWALHGECDANPYWMKPNCQKACNTCGCELSWRECSSNGQVNCPKELAFISESNRQNQVYDVSYDYQPETMDISNKSGINQGTKSVSKCTDSKLSCPYWASIGECKLNPTWMNVNCRKSCKACPKECINDHKYVRNCDYWALIGECNKNPIFMRHKCRSSCKICE